MDDKTPIDVTAATTTALVWMDVLPALAAIIASLMTATWFAIRIYETKTVQSWLRKG